MIRNEKSDLLKTELWISYVLRWGVIGSGSVIALGLLARLFNPGSIQKSSGVPVSAAEALSRVLSGDPDAIISAGLLLLILLPVARVAMTVLLFLFERDWIYLAITVFVLAMLLSSLLLGKAL